MVASLLPGCPAGAEITPVEPDPARTGEGSGLHERSTCIDDRRVGLRRRRRHPGRPEGVRGGGRVRDVGDRRADRAEHGRRRRGPRGARRRSSSRSSRRCSRTSASTRRRRGCCSRRPIIEAVADVLDGRDGAARRRPGDGRLVGREAAAGRRGRRARAPVFPLATVVTPNLPEARMLTGSPAGVLRKELAERLVALGARGGDRHRRARRRRRRPPLRRPRARRDSRRAPRQRRRPTAPAARTRRRSRPCSRKGLPLVDAARAAAAAAMAAVRNGLASIGAGDGPVDVLNLKGRP